MAPRSWIAARRFTITRRAARRLAPLASVTVTTIGRSSGVRPTASASANRSDSRSGRWKTTLVTVTNNTRKTVSRNIRNPNWRMPRSNASRGRSMASPWASPPSSLARPVRTTRPVAMPLITEVPMQTKFAARPGSSTGETSSDASFSAGYASPVSRAWLTNRSRAASSRQSPGTMSPAFSSTTSPGTSRSTATSSIVPLRSTSAFSPTDRRRASTVFSALACWTTSSTTLNRMMPTMSAKLVTSPVHADRPLANSRMRIRGLAKRSRSWRHSGRRRWASASFGPYLTRRRSTSSAVSPERVAPSSASSRDKGRFQGKLSIIVAGS